MSKIVSLDELEQIVGELKGRGKRIVQCHGVFDLLHPGHTLHFEEAKSQGDILVVSVTCDKFVNKGPGRPVFSQDIRMRELATREIVDYVVLSEYPTGVEAIKVVRPDVFAKGPDYKGKQSREREAVEQIGGIYYVTEGPTQSSSYLLNEYFGRQNDDVSAFVSKFKERFSSSAVIKKLQALNDLRVLIIGETIIDEYAYCDVLGASPKDNILTANYVSEYHFPGGVLAVANHIAGFCSKVNLVTLVGRDFNWTRWGMKANIKAALLVSDTPTITKRRYIEPDSFRKLFGVERIPKTALSHELERSVLEYLDEHTGEYDLVVVSDFGHGLLTRAVIDTLCTGEYFLSVNTQTNSANRGFNTLNKYPRAPEYTSLDELELRLTVQDMFSKLEALPLNWKELFGAPLSKLTAVTRGRHGSLIFTKDNTWIVPSLADKVLDPVGAGDAYFAVTSLCAAGGFEPELIGFIGNAVGALKVQWPGNKESIDPTKLYQSITTLLK